MVHRVGLRIAYDGSWFSGFQRQPGKRTVEGDLLSALKRIKAIKDSKSSNYTCSSRTDAGVSAIGNVVSIDTEFEVRRLPIALNSELEDIWCTGTSVLPDDFNIRHARSREYCYFLLFENQDIVMLNKAAEQLIGSHDFSRYGRLEGRNPIRNIMGLKIERQGSLITFKIKGESFLWNQVRRIVWALDQVGRGKACPSDISPERYALKRIGLAPARYLVLLGVDIGFDFKSPEIGERLPKDLKDRFIGAHVRREILRRTMSDLSNRQID